MRRLAAFLVSFLAFSHSDQSSILAHVQPAAYYYYFASYLVDMGHLSLGFLVSLFFFQDRCFVKREGSTLYRRMSRRQEACIDDTTNMGWHVYVFFLHFSELYLVTRQIPPS